MRSGRSRRIFGADGGAIILMGIPMVFFMIGMLYFVVGMGETIVARERLQDAADAGAFSAAIMHARGMNMIALVNQVMAALVALLVMVRLFQALMIAAVAVASALAFWTAGASLAIVPPASQAAVQAETAFENLRSVITPALQGLHAFELGIKYAMPVAAEVRVVDTVANHYSPPAALGFAIPGSYPLPVKPGKWPELCKKAGEYAGKMITFPLDAVIGDNIVGDVIGSGVSALAGEFSSIFCSPNSDNQTPRLQIPEELPEIKVDQEFRTNLPILPSLVACRDAGKDVPLEERQRRCDEAAQEEARSQPDEQNGGPATQCSYVSPLDNERRWCKPCSDANGDACEPYEFKVNNAARECHPNNKDKYKLDSWNYRLREFTWRINLVPVPLNPPADPGQSVYVPEQDDRFYTVEFVSPEPSYSDSYVKDTRRHPCGDGGEIDNAYDGRASYRPGDAGASEIYLCEQNHYHPDVAQLTAAAGESGLALREWKDRFDDPRWQMQLEPYEPARPDTLTPDDQWPPPGLQPPFVPAERPFFIGRWKAVPFVHSCGSTVDTLDDVDFEPPPVESGVLEQSESEACGRGQMLHHEIEDGVDLGSETFQLRSLVISEEKESAAEKVVETIPFRLREQNRPGLVRDAVLNASDYFTKIYIAQAEYYYDTDYDARNERPSHDPSRWLWNMKWRARLRRVRLPREQEQGPDEARRPPSRQEVGACNFDAPSLDVMEACANAGGNEQCRGNGSLAELRDFVESMIVH
ncbi:MAG: hypothetical protein JXA30_08250 [Deltaproteobacteria bacterium]|nr:hypothetical protein [Deltaproteobacteria bacterium]